MGMGTQRSTPNIVETPREISVDRLSRFAQEGYLYAILDACVDAEIMKKAHACGDTTAKCLFHGTRLEEYYAVAPYLFHVNAGLLEWVLKSFSGHPWGLFILTKGSMVEIFAHAQRFLAVLLPNSATWFFRYYDPRILGVYLSSCTADELRMFFGPVRAYAVSEGSSLFCSMPLPQQSM